MDSKIINFKARSKKPNNSEKKKEQALLKLKLKKLEQMEKLQKKHEESYRAKLEKLENKFKLNELNP